MPKFICGLKCSVLHLLNINNFSKYLIKRIMQKAVFTLTDAKTIDIRRAT